MIPLLRPLAFLDTETTGVDVQKDRVVEIAIEIHFPDGRAPERKVRRINPGVPIPADASAVHGITDADVAGEPTFRQVGVALRALLEPCDLIGFGLRRFDVPLLVAEWKRVGVTFDPKRLPSGERRRIVDLLMLFHLESPRDLTAAARIYAGVELADAHSAEADTGVLPSVLEGMLATHAALTPDLDQLHSRCDEYQPYRGPVETWFGDDLTKPVFQFGKNKGQSLRAADNGYIAWMLKQPDMDEDVKRFVREFLRRHAAA